MTRDALRELAGKCEHSRLKGWRNVACKNAAKVERDGKHYCGVHDPVARKQKRDAKDQERQQRYEARRRARAEHEAAESEKQRKAASYDELAAENAAIRQQSESQAAEIAALRERCERLIQFWERLQMAHADDAASLIDQWQHKAYGACAHNLRAAIAANTNGATSAGS